MKTIKSILFSAILLLFIMAGCTRAKSYIYEISLLPQENPAAVAPSDYDSCAAVIRKRLINFGISSEKINILINNPGLSVSFSISDTSDFKVIEKIVTEKGLFGFWETYENKEVIPYLTAANSLLKSADLSGITVQTAAVDTTAAGIGEKMFQTDQDSSLRRAAEEFRKDNPLFSILSPMVNQAGEPMPSPVIGMAPVADTLAVMRMLDIAGEQYIFPRDLFFCWSRDPYRYVSTGIYYELHAVKQSTYSRMPLLDASVIAVAKPVQRKKSSEVFLSIFMNSEGANLWRRMTRQNIDRCIAIILDGKVLLSPRVMSEIENGKSDVTGDFTLPEIRALSCILTDFGRPLPFTMKITGVTVTREE